MTSFELTLPDDWHIHLRDEAALATTVPDIARWAGRAIVMPNLTPPVATTRDALSYRDRILQHVPTDTGFEPLMTLYLTDNTTEAMVAEAADCPHVHGIKLYPAGATTNSDAGVTITADSARTLESVSGTIERHTACNVGPITSQAIKAFRARVVGPVATATVGGRTPILRTCLPPSHLSSTESLAILNWPCSAIGVNGFRRRTG